MSNASSPEKKSGCGILNAVFGSRKFWPRRTTSTGSLCIPNGSVNGIENPMKIPSAGHNSKKRRGSFDDLEANNLSPRSSSSRGVSSKPQPKIPPAKEQPQQQQQQQQQPQRQQRQQQQQQQQHQRQQQQQQQQQHQYQKSQGRKSSTNDTSVVAASRNNGTTQNHVQSQGQNTRKTVPKEAMGISGELEMMIAENQRGRGGGNLVRVSSGNVMVHGSLGNLRQPGGTTYTYTKPATNSRQEYQVANGTSPSKYGVGNVVNKKQQQPQQPQQKHRLQQNGGSAKEGSNSLCRALSCRMDPEELKIMGNEDYKNGRFAEALALYERAIDVDPTEASYRSNKSAALTALGRLLEAVFECREAISIDPQYHRAHHRLANLYLRLGEAEKAIYHFKQAGPEADPDATTKAKVVLGHLKKCDDAKRLKDWHTVLRESGNAMAAGADSAPTIYSLQAEAYMKLHRHQDADVTLTNGPNFDVDQCTKFFGPATNATLLVIKAQVDMAAGRFDDAMEAVQHAARLDSSNRDVGVLTRRARAVSAARSHGNDLFKEGKFSEACVAYGNGLEHEPNNSVLLCNRAACRLRLGQFEKAAEDCKAALNLRPSYSKARLRRADCNAKLRKWEAAIKDYEILLQESPGDEDVGKALFEAQVNLKRQRGEDVSNMSYGNGGVIKTESSEHFRNLTLWPGLSVSWFLKKPGDKRTQKFLEQLSRKYPTVRFLKVEVEDNQSLVKSESISSLPAFKVYKSGSSLKNVPGEDYESLESSIKEYIS